MGHEAKPEEAPFTPEMGASLRQIAVAHAPAKLAQLAAAVGDADAFAHLPAAAAAAFHLGKFTEAQQYAERALDLAPAFAKSWNYGNAIHVAHTVLGLIAVEYRDYVAAIEELHEAGATPGSPQLKTFGPTMHLARELLKAGQVEPVLLYLEQCRVFWEEGGPWLDLWSRKILDGHVPNFFQHSHV